MTHSEREAVPTQVASITELLSDEALGRSLLVFGPPMSGKDRIAFEVLTGSYAAGASPVVITTTDSAEQFRRRFTPFLPSTSHAEDIPVVDCSDTPAGNESDSEWTYRVGSPADLTGIGIGLSKGYERLQPAERAGGRILVDNLTTLLTYSDFDRVFRFVNALNNRATEVESLPVYLLDSGAIDRQKIQKLLQMFSTVVEVEEQDGTTRFRLRGEQTTDWHEYAPTSDGRQQA